MSDRITCVESKDPNVLRYEVIADNPNDVYRCLRDVLCIETGVDIQGKQVVAIDMTKANPFAFDVKVTLVCIDDYHSDRSRICNSQLSRLLKPKSYYREYVLGKKREQTPSMLLGSMVHCLVLEPAEYPNRYAIAPECDRRTKIGKQIWCDFVANNGNKDVITQEQNEHASEIAAELLTHGEVIKCMNLIDADAKIEERLDFDWHGVPSRCKPDLLLPKHKICLDVKTTGDAPPDDFKNTLAKFGYHRQQAFYSEAIKQHYGEEFRFLFAVVETSEPHNTAVYELDAASVDAGRQEINLLLDELERRTRDNDWTPEYSKGIVTLTLPRWYRSNIYEG